MTNPLRMTAAELRAVRDHMATGEAREDRRRVRGTVRVEIDGIRFDSKLESRCYLLLREMQRQGIITDLRHQVDIVLLGRDRPIRTPTGKDMRYRADFTFRRDGRRVVVDAKGHKTDTYLMKKAILSAQGIEIHEYTAKGGLKP